MPSQTPINPGPVPPASAGGDALPAPASAMKPRGEAGGTAAGSLARGIGPLLVIAALALLMHFLGQSVIDAYSRRLILDCSIAVMLAVSLTIVNGFTGQFSIGHAGFMAVGGYAAGFMTYYGSMAIFGQTARVGGFLGAGEWLFVAATLAGGCVAALTGWIVGLPSLRLRGDYLAIVTLGFGEITRVLLQNSRDQAFSVEEARDLGWRIFAPPATGGSQGFSNLAPYTNLFWVTAFMAATLLFAYRLKRSSLGRAMIAVRENEIAAQAMGIDITRYKVRAFVFGAFFAGLAGSLYAHQTGNILRPVDAGFQKSFEIVLMVVLGGLGSISGAALAAIGLTLLPQLLLDLGVYRMILYALMLILVMIFRPQGLFGIREIWDLRLFRFAGATKPGATPGVRGGGS